MEEDQIPVTKLQRDRPLSSRMALLDRGHGFSITSPLRRLSASRRLVSPSDSDQELNDLEVASVLAQGNRHELPYLSTSKSKRHETPAKSPVRPSTVMTNLQRGNVTTITPLTQNLTFHQMAAQGELILLQQEISEGGVNINRVDEYGLIGLHWACANGQLPTVEFLVQNGADIKAVGNHGENTLLFASCYGYVDIVKVLLKMGMDVNYSDETGGTALMYTSFNNHPSCTKLLLEFGADITIANEDQLMAMDLAVGQGHKSVQQVIEKHLLSLFEDT